MRIEITKQITEQADIELPAYFKDTITKKVIYINVEEGVIIVQRNLLILWTKEDGHYRDSAIVEALSDRFQPCPAEVFESIFNEQMASITHAIEANLISQP